MSDMFGFLKIKKTKRLFSDDRWRNVNVAQIWVHHWVRYFYPVRISLSLTIAIEYKLKLTHNVSLHLFCTRRIMENGIIGL